MRAPDENCEKLACEKCNTEVCFKCRAEFHGAGISCEQAGENRAEDIDLWLRANQESCMRCPLCKTPIERNGGCNHMTCALCSYEFCWACGSSAASLDNHFSTGKGCGVKMMQERVIAGQYIDKFVPPEPAQAERDINQAVAHFWRCEPTVLCVLKYFLLVVTFPVTVYIWGVIVMTQRFFRNNTCADTAAMILCFLPGALVAAVLVFIIVLFDTIITLILILCTCTLPSRRELEQKCSYKFLTFDTTDERTENARRARQRMNERLI